MIYFKRRKISDKRRKACLARADRQGGGGDNQGLEEEEKDEQEEDAERDDGDQGAKVSPRSWKRKKAELLEIVPESIVMQRELLKHLVKDFEVTDIVVENVQSTNFVVPKTTLHRYRKDTTLFLQTSSKRVSIPPEDLVMFFAQHLVVKDQAGFFDQGLSFLSQDDIPVNIRVQRISTSNAI